MTPEDFFTTVYKALCFQLNTYTNHRARLSRDDRIAHYDQRIAEIEEAKTYVKSMWAHTRDSMN